MSGRALTIFVVALLSVLGLVFGITGDGQDEVVADGPLIDAEVIEHRGFGDDANVVLRVSDPRTTLLCSIWRDDFDGDWPPVGTVLAVEYTAPYCALPIVHKGTPKAELIIGGSLGLLGLAAHFLWSTRRRRVKSFLS
ncbi:hypothetical protein [Actinoplanes friuliensis]|uniref:Uncharacterized protein n=1 Tax=Actinoplanes friuliensis DSM 7358 TaxID=1246995 RepID=U5VZA9_9ACTN|nr:hypothetical protein [Actinoplanes friuliensis]AGZ42092.1 hypothetical protein AFR_19100 [Actinoplanes friuliensis DSM 7358]